MQDMKNDHLALKNEYFASKEVRDRKIAQLEGKVNSNKGNRYRYTSLSTFLLQKVL